MASQVRLIDEQGEQLGIMSLKEAKKLAYDANSDLVEIAPQAVPPVCRIMDYNKFRFETDKKKAAEKKKQKKVAIKEMAFRPVTGKGDYDVKIHKITGFLEAGDRVKISVRYRGREMSHPELGSQLVEAIKLSLEPYGTIEQPPKQEGRQILMVVAPKKK